ncbi:hypothetical protein QRD43_02495 [Pelomonas sp. APW6]|uniref:Uncharacterized protein n=1 Tax=Roseateles subflavus TaxID=3053353 RepID=A0ABT7LEP6_9BURK|nr:hypothetical protein [Pelomonas sp. APW6]MDL5030762.1 hypothetical protein [Pelomonas sp. APW6]
MEWLVEVIVELLAEFVLALVLEFGGRVLLAPFRGEPSPWVSSLGYLVLGAILGGLSLWLMPHSFLHQPALRGLNLLVTPFAVGATMGWMGQWRAKKGLRVLRMDRFAHGYLMALSLGLVRYFWAG